MSFAEPMAAIKVMEMWICMSVPSQAIFRTLSSALRKSAIVNLDMFTYSTLRAKDIGCGW